MHSKARARIASRLLSLALVGFVLLTALAARAYPGGTYCEPLATSWRFWGNFLCDLTSKVTARGTDNSRSAAFAEAAFGLFGVALGPFFWLLADLAGRRSVRRFGFVSALATVVLGWLPSHDVHAIAVFSATLPGLAAAGLAVAGLLRRQKRARHVRAVALLGVTTFAAGVADGAGYAYAVATHGGCIPWLPALQKLVALSLIAWMVAVVLVGAQVHAARSP